jgi:lysine/ornithine N-monooxygenase
MIGCLHIAAECLIDLSQEMYEKDTQIMRALRQLKFVEEELKPFLEESAV